MNILSTILRAIANIPIVKKWYNEELSAAQDYYLSQAKLAQLKNKELSSFAQTLYVNNGGQKNHLVHVLIAESNDVNFLTMRVCLSWLFESESIILFQNEFASQQPEEILKATIAHEVKHLISRDGKTRYAWITVVRPFCFGAFLTLLQIFVINKRDSYLEKIWLTFVSAFAIEIIYTWWHQNQEIQADLFALKSVGKKTTTSMLEAFDRFIIPTPTGILSKLNLLGTHPTQEARKAIITATWPSYLITLFGRVLLISLLIKIPNIIFKIWNIFKI